MMDMMLWGLHVIILGVMFCPGNLPRFVTYCYYTSRAHAHITLMATTPHVNHALGQMAAVMAEPSFNAFTLLIH
jgi:hypothetical protein